MHKNSSQHLFGDPQLRISVALTTGTGVNRIIYATGRRISANPLLSTIPRTDSVSLLHRNSLFLPFAAFSGTQKCRGLCRSVFCQPRSAKQEQAESLATLTLRETLWNDKSLKQEWVQAMLAYSSLMRKRFVIHDIYQTLKIRWKESFCCLVELFNWKKIYIHSTNPSNNYYMHSISKNYLNFIIFEENISFEVVDGFIYNICVLS